MVPYQNPTIYIGSLRIDEPITTLTDLIFCTVCFYAFFKTKHLAENKAVNLYRWFFLLSGVTTSVGALTGHAFLYYFDFSIKLLGWSIGIISIGFAQFAALYHAKAILGEKKFKVLSILNAIEIAVALVTVFYVCSFVIVEIHSAFGLLLIVAAIEYMNYKNTKSILSKNMIFGIVISILAVLCHVLKLAASEWFNHMDLSHVIMAFSMFIMYKGVKMSPTQPPQGGGEYVIKNKKLKYHN